MQPTATLPVTPSMRLDHRQADAAIGALIGLAVGDALGAPFEFGPAGQYRRRFPQPVIGGAGEMTGGGGFGWAPGEFTDDTQMALALAESLVALGALDADDLWQRWRDWASSANDVGSITGTSLAHDSYVGAAAAAHERLRRSAGNGALMRVAPVGVAFAAVEGDDVTEQCMQVAYAQAALTHHDPAAGWGAAVWAELIRRTILGADPLRELDEVLSHVPAEVRAAFEPLVADDWSPDHPGAPSNGSVWGCLAEALWAVRHHHTFHDVVVAAVDLGGDTDTVAAVAGALAGARHGMQQIPSRWSTYVHGRVGDVRYDNTALQRLAHRLTGRAPRPASPADSPAGPQELLDGVWAADLGQATRHCTDRTDVAVLSLCRTDGVFAHVPNRRELFLFDEEGDHNPSLEHVLADAVDTVEAWRAEGRDVLVHCHGGRSRTALVVKAVAMRQHGWTEEQAHEWLLEEWPHYGLWNRTFRTVLQGGPA